MKLFKGLGIALCLAVLCVIVVPTAKADDWNRKTVITFSGPVEVPGVGQHNLPPEPMSSRFWTHNPTVTLSRFSIKTKPRCSRQSSQSRITA